MNKSNHKQHIDLRQLQQIVAKIIIDSAPPSVDTTHVRAFYIDSPGKKYCPEYLTVQTSSEAGSCNLTVHFDPIYSKNMSYDVSAGKTCNYHYRPTVTIDWDSWTKDTGTARTAIQNYNDMLQLATKIEQTIQDYIAVHDPPGYESDTDNC